MMEESYDASARLQLVRSDDRAASLAEQAKFTREATTHDRVDAAFLAILCAWIDPWNQASKARGRCKSQVWISAPFSTSRWIPPSSGG